MYLRKSTLLSFTLILFASLLAGETIVQTDWSGGAGSNDFTSETSTMFDMSLGADFVNVPGDLSVDPSYQPYTENTLVFQNKLYVPMSHNSTFVLDANDTNTPTLAWGNLSWRYGAVTDDAIVVSDGVNIMRYDGSENDYGFRYPGWSLVTKAGLSDDFSPRAIEYLNGTLYISGTIWTGSSSGGQIYEYTGTAWTQVASNIEQAITSIAYYGSELYIGTHWSGDIYRLVGGSWSAIGVSGMTIVRMIEYAGELYIGSQNSNYDSGTLSKWDGTTFNTLFSGGGVSDILADDTYLYYGSRPSGTVYRYDGSSWIAYFNLPTGETNPDGFSLYNGHLYCSTNYNQAGDSRAAWLYEDGVRIAQLRAGFLRSSDFNLGLQSGWTNFDWQTQIPTGTGIEIFGQSRADEDEWSADSLWHYLEPEELLFIQENHIRYQAHLWSVVPDVFPTLTEISINYDLVEPVDLMVENVHVFTIDLETVEITWETSLPATGMAFLGTEHENYPIEAFENGDYVTQHSVTVSGLDADTEYYFIIDQTTADGEYVRAGEFSFTLELYFGDVAITAVMDVPEDQGGWVYLSWNADSYDQMGMITSYGVWELNPDSVWISLGSVPAVQDSAYIFLAHTFVDSADGEDYWSTFVVTAHTIDPTEFFVSDLFSGYSIDNISPPGVQGLVAEYTAGTGVTMQWGIVAEEDLSHYSVYRGTAADFEAIQPIGTTDQPVFIDASVDGSTVFFYRVTAVDIHDNESDPSIAISPDYLDTDSPNSLPVEYRLVGSYPNPFNPETTIQFELPEASDVVVNIYDVNGRLVNKLVESRLDGGYHSVRWVAEDHHGRALEAGVYLVIFQAGSVQQSAKVLLLK